MCFPFFFNDTATTEIYTLSLHDALPIYPALLVACDLLGIDRIFRCNGVAGIAAFAVGTDSIPAMPRSEEHTSELQSQSNLVCRLLLEKKKHTQHLQGVPRAPMVQTPNAC